MAIRRITALAAHLEVSTAKVTKEAEVHEKVLHGLRVFNIFLARRKIINFVAAIGVVSEMRGNFITALLVYTGLVLKAAFIGSEELVLKVFRFIKRTAYRKKRPRNLRV